MKPTWILVADSSRARIFTAATPSAPLEELEDLTHPESREHEQDLVTDLPGKHRNDTGIGAHGFQDEVEPKEQETINFAKYLARHLDDNRKKNRFQRLILVAAPSFLGLLRNELPDTTRKTVIYTLDKNLTQHTPEDIRAHLPEYLPHDVA